MLVGGSFAYPLREEKRNSIFNPIVGLSNYQIPLDYEDQEIIKEVYKKGFEKRLAKAEIQFKESIIKKIENAKIVNRDPSLWWVQNPLAIIFLPALILVLLSRTPFAITINPNVDPPKIAKNIHKAEAPQA